MPPEVEALPSDRPLIYFAMGSSGVGHVVADLLESFRDTPYQVVAPVQSLITEQHLDVPPNVLVTDWLPALEMNRRADLALIHGGIGTVLTAALAGRPVVGIGMQPEQVANISCLVRKGFARQVGKSRNRTKLVREAQTAIAELLADNTARESAASYADSINDWSDGSARASTLLAERYG